MTDDETRSIYADQRIGTPYRWGTNPGILVVDFQRGFTEDDGPVGVDMTPSVEATATLLRAARAAELPVVFTVIGYSSPADAGVWGEKMPGLLELGVDTPWVDVDPRLERRADESLIVKHGASALFGTNVAAIFTARQVDTVLVTGATTSGCVRASAVDLMQSGFRVVVPEPCVADRVDPPHRASLFDMSAKYADVVSLERACRYVSDPFSDAAIGGDEA